MELSIHNHYVPQMLLNNWAEDGQVLEYNLLVSNNNVPIWSRKNVKSIASINYLYISIQNNKELDDIEKDFNIRFETPAKAILDKIIARERLDSNEWDIIADFASAQYVRTPAFFFWVQSIINTIMPDELKDIANKFNELKPEDIKKINREDIRVKNADLLPITVKNTDVKADVNHTYVEIGLTVGKSSWFFAMKQALEDGSVFKECFKINEVECCLCS